MSVTQIENPLSQQQIDQIKSAFASLQQKLGVDPDVTNLAIENPYAACLSENPGIAFDAETAAVFNAIALAEVPVDQNGRAVRSSSDSWGCTCCVWGIQWGVGAVIAAAGIAISLATGGAAAPAAASGLAAFTSLSGAQIAGIIGSTALGVSAATFLETIARKACEAMNACESSVSVSGPWRSSKIHTWGAPAPGQPALVSFRGQPILLHRGVKSSALYCSSFDLGSGSWPKQDGKVTGSTILHDGGVSAVSQSGTLYALYRGDAGSLVMRTTTDLQSWSAEATLPFESATDVGLAEFNDGLIGILTNSSGQLQEFQMAQDGTFSLSPEPIEGAFSQTQPALEWFGTELLCGYADRATGQINLLTRGADGSWNDLPAPNPGFAIKGGPALAMLNPTSLYMLYTSIDGSLHYSFTGTDFQWASDTAIVGQVASTGPALLGQGSTLFAVHIGKGGENLYFDVAQI